MRKRKKKDIEFSEYTPHESKRGGRKKVRGGLLTTFDQMEYYVVQEDFENDMFKISDIILNGRAVLANFDKIEAQQANEMLLFISGVVYAKEGEVHELGDRLFLFGRKEEYADGSLQQYIEDTK